MSCVADYNPTPHVNPEGANATPLEVVGGDCTATEKLMIVMCGLPATGKTHIGNRIARYISFFLDMETRIFNVADYRRRMYGDRLPASFFDPANAECVAKRGRACDAALEDMTEFMRQSGVRVGILDSTNCTRQRRARIREAVASLKCKVVFLETKFDNEDRAAAHDAAFVEQLKKNKDQYEGVTPEEALEDFTKRREYYMDVYESVDQRDGPHIQIINNQTFVVHSVRGYLPQKVVHFVMNLHTLPRVFYLSRHGQSEYNLLGKIGGDAGLTDAGREYARRLADFAHDVVGTEPVRDEETGEERRVPCPARLWTSTLRRTKETAALIRKEKITTHKWDNGDAVEWIQFQGRARRNLDELYAGICDGLTYKEIEEKYPEEFARRQDDKLTYRYPRGESYMDVTLRLENVVLDIERTREPILIVGHQGIHRLLYAYFMGLPREQAPYVSIPLNTVIQLTPNTHGCDEKRYLLLSKEEMMKDGQDEPVTSMPVKEKKIAEHVQKDTARKTHSYSFDVMNPPSF